MLRGHREMAREPEQATEKLLSHHEDARA